jgi:hypothetical protein
MNKLTELKANLGIVLRGDVVVLRAFMADLDKLLANRSEVQIVHKHVSASKLWIREGEEMNEGERDGRFF